MSNNEAVCLADIIYNGLEHKVFFMENLHRCEKIDNYAMALIYCLGIDEVTRNHVDEIFYFNTTGINTECLQENWQTSASIKVIRLAFNLYTNRTISVNNFTNPEDRVKECQKYSVEELFCCAYAKYFWQAIKIKYPVYCE